MKQKKINSLEKFANEWMEAAAEDGNDYTEADGIRICIIRRLFRMSEKKLQLAWTFVKSLERVTMK